MNIQGLIKKLSDDGMSIQEIVENFISGGFDPDETAKAFRKLDYEATFVPMSHDEGLLRVSPEPCYKEDGYHTPILQTFKWPLEAETE